MHVGRSTDRVVSLLAVRLALLGREMRAFGDALEHSVFPRVREKGFDVVRARVGQSPTDGGESAEETVDDALKDFPRLRAFLSHTGVSSMPCARVRGRRPTNCSGSSRTQWPNTPPARRRTTTVRCSSWKCWRSVR